MLKFSPILMIFFTLSALVTDAQEAYQDPTNLPIPAASPAEYSLYATALESLGMGEIESARNKLENFLVIYPQSTLAPRVRFLLAQAPEFQVDLGDIVLAQTPWFAGNIASGIISSFALGSLLNLPSETTLMGLMGLGGLGAGFTTSLLLSEVIEPTFEKTLWAELTATTIGISSALALAIYPETSEFATSKYGAPAIALAASTIPRLASYLLIGDDPPDLDQIAFSSFAYLEGMSISLFLFGPISSRLSYDIEPYLRAGAFIWIPLSMGTAGYFLHDAIGWSAGKSLMVELGGATGFATFAFIDMIAGGSIFSLMGTDIAYYYLGGFLLGQTAFALLSDLWLPNSPEDLEGIAIAPTILGGSVGLQLSYTY